MPSNPLPLVPHLLSWLSDDLICRVWAADCRQSLWVMWRHPAAFNLPQTRESHYPTWIMKLNMAPVSPKLVEVPRAGLIRFKEIFSSFMACLSSS